ncbi:4-hydroxy-2-oxoheptanedioate aldolase [Amycolatopsis marina]|uniref:4-hydroxy-2-oxoheptanedioate aldolase n=1 Tax=Amycolatopsis marina TaxID=490629 RepID=A0A1I1C1N2_9PSEU|nr:aldolase/citrate lyase family protein [Amycolatopsis marina]SFB55916.1 4-hydroxy-2-oxoheptanedioate aldolase [Amycolatopsis marina]
MKSRLTAGERLLGVLVRLPAEELVEMAGFGGIDYVVVDCEHGPADVLTLRRHIAAAQLHGMDVLVRVGQNEPALVQRVLDQGATGVIVPHVDTPEQAAAVVDHAHYPPLGSRGFATYGRDGGYGTVQAVDHLRSRAERTLVVVMIESRLGCANAERILAVQGVDGVMVGPADLAVSLGHPGAAGEPRVRTAVDSVHEHAARLGRVRADIVPGPDEAKAAMAHGAGLVVINLSHVLMGVFGALREASGPKR